jgi:GNAT superfamily N-acetyltransferase
MSAPAAPAAPAVTAPAVRALTPDDRERLCDLWDRLSPATRMRRFNSAVPCPGPALLDAMLDVDGRDRAALAAVDGDDIVAVARYAAGPGERTAEVAIVVADDWQRRGLGTRLLTELFGLAARNGFEELWGTTGLANEPLLRLVYDVAPDVHIELRPDLQEYDLRLPLGKNF